MMILISGQPGNGKTLRAMALLLEEHTRNLSAHKLKRTDPKWEALRPFHANIRGITFDWVKPIPLNDRGEPDYRLCGDGAYVVFDEAHSDGKTPELLEYGKLFPSTGKPGESDDERIRAMSTHRHRGFDLVFVTQWPSKIHHQVRTLVGRHIHMNRSMGLNIAGTFTWQRVQSDPYDEKEREKAEEEMWSYPKDLFDKYRSATLHTSTYKFKVPAKVWSALSTAVVVALITFGAYSYSTRGSVPEGENLQGESAQTEAPQAPVRAPASPPVVDMSTAHGYVQALTPTVRAMPWTAPAFSGREVVSQPRVFCSHSKAGLDGNGDHVAESCSCVTEQATEYRMPVPECQYLARHGEGYNPYREPVSESRGGAGVSPAVMGASAPDWEGVGDSENIQQPYGGMRPRS